MRKFAHNRKISDGRDGARILWFLDDREAARKADPHIIVLDIDQNEERAVWEKLQGQILALWIESHPGTRPSAWWRYGDGVHVPELRRVLSGAGRPACIEHGFGIPHCWEGFSADNPPTFESESMYLKRHGLLTPAEQVRRDFSPVTVSNEDDLTFHYGRFEVCL